MAGDAYRLGLRSMKLFERGLVGEECDRASSILVVKRQHCDCSNAKSTAPGWVSSGLAAIQYSQVACIQTALDLVAFGALFTWAWQELFEGVNYFRRSLGLIGLITLIALGLNLSRAFIS